MVVAERSHRDLEAAIDGAWEERGSLTPQSGGRVREAVEEALELLDSGRRRVAEPDGPAGGGWTLNPWLKKAVLLSFRLTPTRVIPGAPGRRAGWFDKVDNKFEGWDEARFAEAGFRAVPHAIVRRGAHIAPGAVLMPCFVNIGGYVGAGSMIDSWATVGSCAQVGANCHISGGAGLGGVLEPLQAAPVIVEDGCFIGARSEVVEGVVVERGAVLSMGVFIGASTKIVDRETGEVHRGRVPAFSVVVPGALPPRRAGEPSLACAVIIKRVDEGTRAKTAVNELLRD